MSKKQIKDYYNKIAPDWRQKVWVQDTNFKKEIIKFANINPNSLLLDVGIGAGDLAALFKVKSVTGVDISKSMLKECKKLHPNYKLILGDAEKLPIKDNFFDVVCSRNLLQNFNNPTKAFNEMVRVLKKGGLLVVIEAAVDEYERDIPTKNVRVAEPFHPLFPSHEMLKKLFEKSHLKHIKQEVSGVHKKWLSKWCISKKASNAQKLKIYKLCEDIPSWYIQKYSMKLYPNELEVESTLSFSLLKGRK